MTGKWLGPKPGGCNICNRKFVEGETFIDGKTVRGPWANMCTSCHNQYGVGLGTGKGQEYNYSTLEKIRG